MAKIKNDGLTSISGKFNDVVHVQSNTYKPHVRKAIAEGGNKDEPAFKAQHERTIFLNRLAADLNKIFAHHSGLLKPKTFYHDVQKRLRKEPLNNRFLLLMQLKEMEVNKGYKLSRLSYHSVDVSRFKNKLNVALHIKGHAESSSKHKADCYCYEVMFVSWTKGANAGIVQRQLSDWVSMDGELPVFDFKFELGRGVVHWMLCLRVMLGMGEEEIGLAGAEGMAVVEVGSLDKGDWALLEARGKESVALETGSMSMNVREVARVKARKSE